MRWMLVFTAMLGCSTGGKNVGGSITVADWGQVDGKPVRLYTLANGKGMTAKITNYGTILVELHVPDRTGKPGDVVLGMDDLAAYLKGHPFFGATAGRVANRIAKGKFTLDGKEYTLAVNNGPNHLHGGKKGFDKYAWDAATSETPEGPSLKMTLVSPDGDEGYPGRLTATVTYTLTTTNELRVEMTATTEAPTIVNLAHHTYWNLGGHASGSVVDHELQLNADQYTPPDESLIPLGNFAPVEGTPFDFRKPKRIGADHEMTKLPYPGYDTNFVVRGEIGKLRPAATVYEPKSGRVMELLATEPGVQLYTAIHMNDVKGKVGAVYNRHGGFCLETQKHPDSVNKSDWPSPVLRPGQTYRHVMVHRFSTR